MAEKRDLLATAGAELIVERWVEVDQRERVPRDAGSLEAARSEEPNVGVSLCDPGSPAGVQLNRENVVLRNTKALGELHEGLGFSGTWVEDVYILGLGLLIRRWVRDLQVPEDTDDRRWRCRVEALLEDGCDTRH